MDRKIKIGDGFGVLSALVFLLLLFCVLRFTVEGPEADDAQMLIGSIVKFYGADGLAERFYFLAEQNAEHRFLTTRLLALASVALFGEIRIQLLMAIGVLTVALIAVLLYRDARQAGSSRPHDLLVLALLLGCPAYWGSLFAGWGTSNFGSVLYTALAIVLLHRRTVAGFAGFLLAMALAIFTQTNGWFAAMLGFLVLPFGSHRHRYAMLCAHLVVVAVLYRLYFFEYDHYEHGYAMIMNQALADPVAAATRYGLWVLAWLGSWIFPIGYERPAVGTALWLSVVMGLAMLVFSATYGFRHRALLWRHCRNRLWLFLFVLASIAVGSLARSQLGDPRYVLNNRYAFYSLCAVALLYSLVSAVERIRQGQRQSLSLPGRLIATPWLVLILALGYCAHVYYQLWPDLQAHRQHKESCVALWQESQEAMPCWWHGENGTYMKQADALGILRIDYGVLP